MPTHSTKDRTEPVRWADRGRGTDDDVDSPEWRRARERMADVRTVVGDNTLTGGLAAVLSQRWGVTTRTVWRRVQKYRAEGGISAFLDRPPGIRLAEPRG